MKKYIIQNLLLFAITVLTFTNCTTDEPKPNENKGPDMPELTTKPITEISTNTAVSGGIVVKNDGSNILETGICWSLEQNPTISDSITKLKVLSGEFTASLRNLLADKTYYVRAFATNYDGTAYGNELSFKTLPPSIAALQASIIKTENTTISLKAEYTNQGGLPVTSKGFCWSKNPNPTIADNKTEVTENGFSGMISGLTSGEKYYIRAFAVNSIGVGYGNEISATTSIADLDGNNYRAVTIGNQTWMVENLRTRKYNDGTNIPNITDTDKWTNLTTGAWCDFTNNASYAPKYGHLYNWHAANNDKLAPAGWHIPTENEWLTLISYLGGAEAAGAKLKEKGTANWKSPNTGATNESGFTALPGGWTYMFFFNMGSDAAWWTKTEDSNDQTKASSVFVFYNYENVLIDKTTKTFGLSIRCIRDN
jgi:uncharacterized protein (TIGR02145 family)